MTVTDFQVEGYRSLKFLHLRPRPVNVIVGPNGCGKSNLYKSLRLLAALAEGRFARTLSEEGGMPSALWAGPRGKGPVRMKLTVKLAGGIKYEFEVGLPRPGESPFPFDPQVKEEHVSYLTRDEKISLLSRKGQAVYARDNKGARVVYPNAAAESESVMADLKEPHLFPELSALRQEFLSWRFYHKFRTDESSPLRQEQPATRTACLSHDGADLAAALKTIGWIGDAAGLQSAIEDAFPGSRLVLNENAGRISAGLEMPGFERAFDIRELSDGTLHFLCLLAALLAPRPAGLLALNEPEASLHPNLLPPLANLLASVGRHSQIFVITHSFELAGLLAESCRVDPIELERVDTGSTKIKGQGLSYS